jgi:DNA mismatch repair protein MutS
MTSLLWPKPRTDTPWRQLSDQAAADLDLAVIVQAIAGASRTPSSRAGARERFVRQVLTELVTDAATIAYRQAVLGDLLDNPALRERLEDLLPSLEALGDAAFGERYRPGIDVGLERVARRLADLELLVETVARLADALREARLTSESLCSAQATLEELRSSTEFASMERELPELRAKMSTLRSITLGVNLGADLNPESATILELRSSPVDGRRSLLFRLFGGSSEVEALSPLQRGEAGPLGRPNELVRDLRHLLSEVVAPVQSALLRFSRMSSQTVSQLAPELAFFLGAAQLVDRLRSLGLPICRPEWADPEQRRTELVDLYDAALALRVSSPALVTNTARFDADGGRVWVLTGPNRGGKTTYTRAVGLAHVLFQAGLFVPARSARMSPADAIFSHFPAREETSPGGGRLDAEAERLASIFREATPRSLILLNEALSGTSALEALDLARGLVRALRLLGARAIYVTHLHELALAIGEINATTPGDGVVASLVASSAYEIVPGPPSGISFAAEIAEQHGISYTQLERLLRERHLA